MAASGQTTINFGAFPGASDVEITLTGLTGIADASAVEAWILPATTADHSINEHVVDGPQVKAYSPSAAGASMKIGAVANPGVPVVDPPNNRGGLTFNNNAPRAYGIWNVGWVWN